MITQKVLLNNIESVNCFVKKMSDKSFDVDLISGKYLVNAKSMMGVLSLDLTQPVTVNADTDDEAFLEEIKEYIFEEN
ncbi:MAG: HPr family phosphocarrier protein [Acutalibacteraceae bacterium]|nr:HPr family phosphocarrier protein [Acutalibacteraceae bacterium]